MSVRPSSKSRRSPASTFSRIGASVSSSCSTATVPLSLSVDDGVCKRYELVLVQLAVEACSGAPSVVQRNVAGAFERTRCGNPHERSFERAARERHAHDVVLLRREEQRQG